MAGSGTLRVQFSLADSTLWVDLQETTPGRFVTLSPILVDSPGVVTLLYLDNNPGNGRPPSLLTRSMTVP